MVHPSLKDLEERDRRQLLQLAVAAAWSNAEVAPEERRYILGLCAELAVGDAECAEVREWMEGPAPWVDPQEIPRAHRERFLSVLEDVLRADGTIDPTECEVLRGMREMLR